MTKDPDQVLEALESASGIRKRQRLESRRGTLLLSDEDRHRLGGVLVLWLYAEANRRGQQLSELAAELRVTPGYIQQLRTGTRNIAGASRAFYEACAAYVGAPVASVMMASGALLPSDFYPMPNALPILVRNAITFIRDDPKLGPFVPASVDEAPIEHQLLIVKLYEQATGRACLPGALDIDELLQNLPHEQS